MADLIGLLHSREDEESRTRRINGVVVGIVTNNKDDEQLGRVKLHFPWLSNDNETDWSRICSFMAGSQTGSFFPPEVGVEVLVAFENGDFNRPYVLGSLWSKEDKAPPPGNVDGKNNIKKIHSRSGHEIIFDDTDPTGKLEIHTGGKPGLVVRLDDTNQTIVIQDETGNNSVQIDSFHNSISISSQSSISISASNIDIEATEQLTLNAGVVAINGNMVTIN
jgi:uncharacterized protein involved in type VI secretion and phage assembly